jgi:hypothetical protein
MSAKSIPWCLSFGGFVLLGILTACAVGVGGYGGPVGYEGGFYEPSGYEYGGWGGRYHVGPPPGGARGGGVRGGGGHVAPSIPSGPRGGTGHGGGGHPR